MAIFGVLLLAVAGLSLIGVRGLIAEPYFSVRDGYKCSTCHVNRTGGGKRTDYAEIYLETRASMPTDWGRDADGVLENNFGNGRLHKNFSMNADVRAVAEHRHFVGQEDHWQFGRQASCESCHASLNGGGKVVTLYEQLELLPGRASIVAGQSLVPGITSREAYGLLEMDTLNAYVKAGLFRMPSALRNTFDDPYLHGTVQFSATHDLVGLEAVRADGIEVGIEPGPFSVSLSVTNPGSVDKLSAAPNKAKRIHLNAYAVSDLGLIGISAYQDPVRETLEREYRAIYGGVSFGRFTTLLEYDAYEETDPVNNTSTEKVSVLGQIDFLISRGQNLKLQYEAFDPNTEVEKDVSDRTSLIYEPFVTPFLQVRGGARRSEGPRELEGFNGTTVFMELHFIY